MMVEPEITFMCTKNINKINKKELEKIFINLSESVQKRDYNNINTFLSGLKSISGSYDSNEDKLKFNLEARLKKQDKN